MRRLLAATMWHIGLAGHLQVVDPAFAVSRLREYLGPYQKPEFVEKYAEGLRLAGLPE